jgi:hypothetical protein
MGLFHLGFPGNRRPFYAMAEAHPPAAWRDAGLPGRLRRDWAGEVKWGQGRPANRAETRLRQYAVLSGGAPDWMVRLRRPPAGLLEPVTARAFSRGGAASTVAVRDAWRLRHWRDWLYRTVFNAQLPEGLANRLWIDVLLPLLAAQSVLPEDVAAVLWFHSHAGQYPDAFRPLLRMAGVHAAAGRPLCNGWIQGMVWADDQLRLERIRLNTGQDSPAAGRPSGVPSGA